MKFRFYFLLFFFAALFLFYPGDSYFYHLFAYHRDVFNRITTHTSFSINAVPYTKNIPFPYVTAQGIYIADLPSLTPLYEKNAHNKFFPASTTKIITALVASDLYKPDDVVTIKRVLTEGQVMGLEVGEKITVENLLYGTLIYSGNDAAYALADHYGYDAFVAKMNAKAKELGMKQSSFENPAGLDSMNQQSSPYDLALAARTLLENKFLSKVVAIKEITISDVDFRIFHQLTNVNKLLGEIQGVGGLKTGYTENAGENLVSFYKQHGHEFIIVILKSDDRFADTTNILHWIDQSVAYDKVNISL